ncbi:hypothetical protein EVAR_73413_1 [Eumeta japonica]|uniref:Uncharacterized protein n=1 Tax=Eumeta variegata TaxID=151549 RepID=A0A4C1TH73_EUMVA|nr:hypothetical protein EVAR_73413_1 [Eumeta japonica]
MEEISIELSDVMGNLYVRRKFKVDLSQRERVRIGKRQGLGRAAGQKGRATHGACPRGVTFTGPIQNYARRDAGAMQFVPALRSPGGPIKYATDCIVDPFLLSSASCDAERGGPAIELKRTGSRTCTVFFYLFM